MTLPELESLFASIELPETISIIHGETITDVSAFIQSHLEIVRKNGHIPAFRSFYDRLYLLAETLNEQNEQIPK